MFQCCNIEESIEITSYIIGSRLHTVMSIYTYGYSMDILTDIIFI